MLLALLLWLPLVKVVPATRNLMVVQGASTMSSWSMPIMLAPLRLSTPRTRKETLLMRISLPMGDSPLEQLALQGLADHAHLVQLRTSRSVNISPSDISSQSRTARKAGVVPLICRGTQLWLP